MVSGRKMPIISSKRKFSDALKIMNQKKLGVVVVTKNRYILGLITDGDLRRVLDNSSKEKKLHKIIRHFPLVINENTPASKALGIMNEKKNNKFTSS